MRLLQPRNGAAILDLQIWTYAAVNYQKMFGNLKLLNNSKIKKKKKTTKKKEVDEEEEDPEENNNNCI